ncbi:MAG: CueP family metal-binding protein [Candidatus Kapabacteria bacterium]|nr:CueP family metal-binding protein [Candidatus Kapabacteria bacterium]
MNYISILMVFASLLFTGCPNTNDPNYDTDYNTISGMDLMTAIAKANEWHYSEPKISSNIDTYNLNIIFPDGRKISKVLPSDSMYIAIAPYITKTHDCAIHNPGSCQGEQVNVTMHFKITDNANKAIYDSDIQTLKNGFAEFWLPRDKNLTILVTYAGKSATQSVKTDHNCNTCITTMKLN